MKEFEKLKPKKSIEPKQIRQSIEFHEIEKVELIEDNTIALIHFKDIKKPLAIFSYGRTSEDLYEFLGVAFWDEEQKRLYH